MSDIKKKKDSKKYIIILAIIFILMIANMCLIIKIVAPKLNKKETKNISKNPSTSNQNQVEEISEEEEIRTLSEKDRMKRYIGIFLNNIEEGNYQDAYKVLNKDFRDTYFPTLKDFTDYADKNFKSNVLGVTYDNIERLGNNKTGNMYVIWITTDNIFAPKREEDEKEQTNFVIIENGYNNYEMSFSVNEE